jgi:hypothetical protein
VRVHHDEDLASHIDPESCADIREGAGEALTGEHAGQLLSRERRCLSGCRRGLLTRKATPKGAPARAPCGPGVVEDPGMYGSSLCGNREISSLTPRQMNEVVRIGKARSRSR